MLLHALNSMYVIFFFNWWRSDYIMLLISSSLIVAAPCLWLLLLSLDVLQHLSHLCFIFLCGLRKNYLLYHFSFRAYVSLVWYGSMYSPPWTADVSTEVFNNFIIRVIQSFMHYLVCHLKYRWACQCSSMLIIFPNWLFHWPYAISYMHHLPKQAFLFELYMVQRVDCCQSSLPCCFLVFATAYSTCSFRHLFILSRSTIYQCGHM